MITRLEIAALAGVLGVALTGCAKRGGHVSSIEVTLRSPGASAPPSLTDVGVVVVAPVIDARPAALRASHGRYLQSNFSMVAMGQGAVTMFSTRYEGSQLHAGDDISLVLGARRGSVTSTMSEVVRGLVAGETGRDVRVLTAALPANDPARAVAALGAPDGIVVIPVLDQLDVSSLASSSSMAGGSSYETSRTPTTVTTRTTSGAAAASSSVGPFANARLRLVVVRVQGGQVAKRHVVYGRGAGGSLDQAIEDMTMALRAGLGELAPPPPPPAPIVEPAPPEEPAADPASPPPTSPEPSPPTPPAPSPPTPPAPPQADPSTDLKETP
ncbi:MAG TPA: hypothetical protein VM513_16805 [Kofleriaceae bacterium]|nr:hypothetical protein [Kofleriaceae bacterium]